MKNLPRTLQTCPGTLSLWAALVWVEGGLGQNEIVLLLLVGELEGEEVVVQTNQMGLVVGQEVVQLVQQVS